MTHTASRGHRNPGWERRLGERTLTSGALCSLCSCTPAVLTRAPSVGVGAAAGTCYALVCNEPALAASAATSASFGIAAGTFFSLQELCRLLRQADGPENSLLAGAASGALLRGVHHGRAFALPGALAAGALAYAAHLGCDAHAEGRLGASLGLDRVWASSFWSYLPIRRMSDEEVAEREAREKLAFTARVDRTVVPAPRRAS